MRATITIDLPSPMDPRQLFTVQFCDGAWSLAVPGCDPVQIDLPAILACVDIPRGTRGSLHDILQRAGLEVKR